MQSEIVQDEDLESCSSYKNDIDGEGYVLNLCKSHEFKRFIDETSLKKHLSKKLASIDKFQTLYCNNRPLYYLASEYLAKVIKSKGSRPLNKVDLKGAFKDDNMETAEV